MKLLPFVPRRWADLGERDPVNATNPAPEVALVGEACARRDFRQTGSPLSNERDRLSQSQMHDVAVRSHADGSGEHAGEMERAAPRDVCQRRDLYRLVQ